VETESEEIMAMNEATRVLDELVETLEGRSERSEAVGEDAISAVLKSRPRETNVRSLRNSPEVTACREALS
jgi:hypothetical protein